MQVLISISCRKLKRLNLGGNELTSVPQKSLSILDTLKKLEIQENKIRSIKEGDFEGKMYKYPCGTEYPFILTFTRSASFQRIKNTRFPHLGSQLLNKGSGKCVSASDAIKFTGIRRKLYHVYRQGCFSRA